MDSEDISISDCLEILAYMQRQVASGAWNMMKFNGIASSFETVLSSIEEKKALRLRQIMGLPLIGKRLWIFTRRSA
jgi:hypothetical protein